jgi:hypothetical protein
MLAFRVLGIFYLHFEYEVCKDEPFLELLIKGLEALDMFLC